MKLIHSLKRRWVIWVWNGTPTCAEMSRLSSQSIEQPASLGLRFKMWLHFLICAWCKRYQKHLQFLHRAAPRLNDELDKASNRSLSDEAKQRMKQRLRQDYGG